jgi:hypothetical protein
MEGWFAGSMAELDKPSRFASWNFSVTLDGRLFQHYPVTVSTWASGNATANQLISVESEGTAAVALTSDQVSTVLRLFGDWEAWSGLVAKRGETVWEHRQVWNWTTPNAGATACPSERYAPVWDAMEGGTDMALIDEVVQALGGIDAIRAWNANGNSLLLGYSLEQRKLAELTAKVAEHVATHPVEDHKHGGVI